MSSIIAMCDRFPRWYPRRPPHSGRAPAATCAERSPTTLVRAIACMPAPPYGAAQGHELVGSVDPSGDAVHTFTQHRTEDLLTAVVHARKEYA